MLRVQCGFRLVQMQVVALEGVAEIIKSRWDAAAVCRGRCETDVIDDSHPNEVRVPKAVTFENAGQRAHKEERAERIALCYPFIQSVRDYVVHGKGNGGVCSEVNSRRNMIEKAEPCCEEGTVEKLNCFPHVFAKNIVKRFFQVAGDHGASTSGRGLGQLDKFFATPRYGNAKVECRDEMFFMRMWKCFGHDHEGGYANKAFGDAKVAELDDSSVGALVE